MPYGLYLSASGAQAQNHRLEVLSNNLANVATPGYKPQQAILQSRFSEMIEQGTVAPGMGGADEVGGGVTMQASATQFGVGPIRETGNRTDFAINDQNQFFVVDQDGEQALTRAGDFLFDSSGRLVNQKGNTVLDVEGEPIQIDPTLPYAISDGGQVQQAGEAWDLMIARPRSLGDLSHLGENLFKPLAEFDLAAANQRAVRSGYVEESGVSPTTAMMELIDASRTYEANVRMIQNQDHAMGELISRVLQG